MRSMVIRPVMLALVVASLGAGAYLGTASTRVLAAETHSNCATFDNNGNITGVTPNCSETLQAAPSSMSSPSTDPCTSAPGIFTMNDNHSVFHINVNGAGDVWVTGTDGGTASFAAVSPGPSGSGPWTSWFGGAINKQSQVLSSTMHLTIRLSDGTSVTMHDVSHMIITPGGPGVSFNKPTATFNCG
jgi:hypothetical protein